MSWQFGSNYRYIQLLNIKFQCRIDDTISLVWNSVEREFAYCHAYIGAAVIIHQSRSNYFLNDIGHSKSDIDEN